MFAGGFERIWADDFVCMSVCVCILKHVCGCLGAWRCFGGKHKARWPGLKTLLFQLTSPAACSSTGLIWRQRERETDGDGGGGMSWDTARQSGLEGTPKKGLRGWKGEKENEQRTHFTTSQHFCKCLLTYHYSTLISLHTHFHLRLPSLQMRGNNFRKKKDPASLFRNGGTESVHLTGLETFKW